MDFMWGMRESRSPLQSGASSNTWNPFAPLASEIVMFQSNGARRTTNCPVEVKYTRGDWHVLWIIIREIITVLIFSYRAILLLGEPLWACPRKSLILNLHKKCFSSFCSGSQEAREIESGPGILCFVKVKGKSAPGILAMAVHRIAQWCMKRKTSHLNWIFSWSLRGQI